VGGRPPSRPARTQPARRAAAPHPTSALMAPGDQRSAAKQRARRQLSSATGRPRQARRAASQAWARRRVSLASALRLESDAARLVLAAHALDVDVQVQLAHAADDRLPRVAVGAHLRMRHPSSAARRADIETPPAQRAEQPRPGPWLLCTCIGRVCCFVTCPQHAPAPGPPTMLQHPAARTPARSGARRPHAKQRAQGARARKVGSSRVKR